MKHTKYFLFLLIFIILVSHWRWIFLNSYFSWGDVRYPTQPVSTWKSMFALPSLWSTYLNGLGGIDVLLTSYPTFNLLFSGLVTLGFDPRLVLKIIYLFPIPFVSVLGSFFLIRHFTKSNIGGFIGSLVYGFNVTTLVTRVGDLSTTASYSFTPLVLFLYVKSLQKNRLKLSVLCGLVSLICSTFDFRIFYIVAFVMVFYALYHFFFINHPSLTFLKNHLLGYLVPFVVVFLLSLYWLVPLYFTGSLQSNSLFNRPIFGNQYASLRQSVAFFSPWWTAGHGYANGVVQPIPAYFWLIPILALLGFILNFKKKYVGFFLFLSLLGILLTKQSDYPFPHLYAWLYAHFPGFNAYREASKFFVILALGYSHLIGYLASWLEVRFSSRPLRFFRTLIYIAVSGLFLINVKPFISGRIGGLFLPKTQPSDYSRLNTFLSADRDFFRTLWLPAISMWGYFSQNHPYLNAHTSYFDTWSQVLPMHGAFIKPSTRSASIPDVNNDVLSLFSQNYSANFLGQLSVKYVIVPLTDTVNDDNVFVNYGMPDRPYLINYLNNLPYLKPITAYIGNIRIYENTGYLPLFYLASPSESIFSSSSAQLAFVTYSSVSPTQYELQIQHLKSAGDLVFSQTFSPDWQLIPGINHFPQFSHPIYPPQLHTQLDSTFNSFRLSPDLIRKNFPPSAYTINPDGSVNLTATLYFRPQTYVYFGFILSFAFALVAVALLVTPSSALVKILKHSTIQV